MRKISPVALIASVLSSLSLEASPLRLRTYNSLVPFESLVQNVTTKFGQSLVLAAPQEKEKIFNSMIETSTTSESESENPHFKQKLANTRFDLGVAYFLGLGTPKNNQTATQYFALSVWSKDHIIERIGYENARWINSEGHLSPPVKKRRH